MPFGFFIKGVISFFIAPFGFIFSLFVLGLYFLYKQQLLKAKLFLSLSFLFLSLFSYPKFANFLIQNLENKYQKYDYSHNIEYIHVLGNGHNTDKTQPLSSHLSDASTKRVLEGIFIYKNTQNSKIIFTGYKDEDNASNSAMSAKFALALGVRMEDIILGEQALDTYDEALFCKKTVKDAPFVLVTSATHMQRAMKLFKMQGLHPLAAPTDFKRESITYLNMPSANALMKSQIAMHEYIGMLWTSLRY